MWIRTLARKFWIKQISLGSFSTLADILEPDSLLPFDFRSIPFSDLADFIADLVCPLQCIISFQFPQQPSDGVINLFLDSGELYFFSAEALAIGTAIDELISPSRSFIIFTDSLSALETVLTASPSVILWHHAKLRRVASFISRRILCWDPGHRDIPLNEKADHIAKQVGEQDTQLDWISPEDLNRYNDSDKSKAYLYYYETEYMLSGAI